MSLRWKLVLALALLAALASIGIGWFSYAATADRLKAEIDVTLDNGTQEYVRRLSFGRDPDRPGRDPYPGIDVGQVIDARGTIRVPDQDVTLPVDARDLALAADPMKGRRLFRDVSVSGDAYRMATTSVGQGVGAVQVARSLAETNRVLDALRARIMLGVALVVATAALIGWVIARQVTRRLERLTRTAEEVTSTGRLDVPVPVQGGDEAGRLGVAFNEMLGALARSKDEQQRLVQDAGHELRTPLTSLRTNISVLRRHDRLPPETMARVLDDLEGEALELTSLTNELVELATDRRSDEPEQEVALRSIAERVAERARRRTGREIVVRADDSVVIGRPNLLERAVGNLVDNAAKFDDGGHEPIELVVVGGRVEVLDRGPGIDPADLPHLFDRFYRAVAARSRPGSGLGLAIVKDVAQVHGGTVFAVNRPGGGADIGFSLPRA